MLLVVGEGDYAGTTIEAVIERAKISRSQFDHHFVGKHDCFARAHQIAVREICNRVLAAGANAPTWRAGLRAALQEFLEFVSDQPLAAKVLLIDVRAAGGSALLAHNEAVDRLARTIDSARRQPEAAHSPPKLTARLMVGGVESSACAWLTQVEGTEVMRRLPTLMYLIVLSYFGEDLALQELAAADDPRP